MRGELSLTSLPSNKSEAFVPVCIGSNWHSRLFFWSSPSPWSTVWLSFHTSHWWGRGYPSGSFYSPAWQTVCSAQSSSGTRSVIIYTHTLLCCTSKKGSYSQPHNRLRQPCFLLRIWLEDAFFVNPFSGYYYGDLCLFQN